MGKSSPEITSLLFAFGLAFVLGLAMTRFIIFIGHRFGWVDHPDEYRKLHTRAVPRIGGIGIYVAAVLPILMLYFGLQEHLLSKMLHEKFATNLLGLLLGCTVSSLMGLYDDLRSLLARYKLFWQAVAALIAFQAGFAIETIQVPFVGSFELGWFSMPLTMFWYMGCMNAVNLLDGLDGLAAGVCLLASLTMFLVSLMFYTHFTMLLTATLSGALLGFLVYNFHPAKVFLGDSGSMLLGFLLASFGVFASQTAETAVTIIIPIIVLGLPILDTSIVIARRWSQKLPLSAPDRRHIHHRLLAMGLSHKRAVLMLYFMCTVFGCAALLLTVQRNEVTLMVIGSLAIIIFVCVRVFGGLRLRELTGKVSSSLRLGKLDSNARMAIDQATHHLAGANSIEDLWQHCQLAWTALALDYATLSVFEPGEEGLPETHSWPESYASNTEDFPYDDFDHWAARIKLRDEHGTIVGELKVAKTMHGQRMLAAAPELLDRLRADIACHLARILAIQPQAEPETSAGQVDSHPASGQPV